MIYDKLENAPLYYGVHPNFEKAMRFVSTLNCDALPIGPYATGDEDFTIEVLEYTPESKYGESATAMANRVCAHRDRGEVWVQLTSSEQLKLAPVEECESVYYDKEQDFEELKAFTHTVFPMIKGFFVALLPSDGHNHEPIGKGSFNRKLDIFFRM